MFARTLKGALVASTMFVGAAQAQEVVEWWDFLGGGDGVRMKQLIEEFNAEHAGAIQVHVDRAQPFRPRLPWAKAPT